MTGVVAGRRRRPLRVVAHRAPQLGVSLLLDRGRLPGQVRRLLVELGPAYAKIGQILSTRADALPEQYLRELASLRDAVPPESPAAIRDVLTRAYPDGLDAAFASFDERPFAAGTVAQVHAARLHTGERVAVKVLRPGVDADLRTGLDALVRLTGAAHWLSRSARVLDVRGLATELRELLLSQTDLDAEARNYRRFRREFEDDPGVVVPRVFAEASADGVLVTEFVDGVPPYDTDHLELAPLTLAHRVDDLIDDMIFLKGLCHADLHPGNFFWTRDGRLVLVDLGLVHQLSPQERNHLVAFYAALVEGFHDFAAQYFLRHFVTALPQAHTEGIPRAAFEQMDELVRRHWAETNGRPSFSRMFSDVLRLLMRFRLRLGHDYSRLFLTLVTMEGYLFSLDPRFDTLENARRKRGELAQYTTLPDVAHELVFGVPASSSAGLFADGASPETAYRDRDAFVLDALRVGPGSSFIDVGCGRGQLLEAAGLRKARATGLTISPVEHASCLAKGLDCRLTSWERLGDGSGDDAGRVDAMAALEMDSFLATLHENRAGLLDLKLSRFFGWASSHLRQDGRLFLQSLTVTHALLHDPALSDAYNRLTDVTPWLGFATLPQLVRCSDPYFTVEQALDHSADLLPTYRTWQANTNGSIVQLRSIVEDEVLVKLRRQLDTILWLAERGHVQLYRVLLRAKADVTAT